MLVKFDYGALGKGDKGLLRRFLLKATGLSRAQLTRLVGQQARTGHIVDRLNAMPGVGVTVLAPVSKSSLAECAASSTFTASVSTPVK